MRTCALYVRACTPDENLEEQFILLRKAAARRGYQVIAQYSDRVPLASNGRRRGLESLLGDVRRHKFDVLLVASLSTLFRSSRDMLETIDKLHGFGVGLVSVKERLNTAGRSRGTACLVLKSIAGLESDIRREKVRFGLFLRKLQGFSLGRHSIAVGREAIVRDRMSGMSLTDVAKKYAVSRATVVRFTREAKEASRGRI